MGWGVTSVARRSAWTGGGWCEGGSAMRMKDRVEDVRGKAGVGVQARPASPQGGELARLGAILAQLVDMASAE